MDECLLFILFNVKSWIQNRFLDTQAALQIRFIQKEDGLVIWPVASAKRTWLAIRFLLIAANVLKEPIWVIRTDVPVLKTVSWPTHLTRLALCKEYVLILFGQGNCGTNPLSCSDIDNVKSENNLKSRCDVKKAFNLHREVKRRWPFTVN